MLPRIGSYGMWSPSRMGPSQALERLLSAICCPWRGTGTHPTSVAMLDLNGDGKLDLVTANYADPKIRPRTVSVFLGKGDGNFSAKADYATGAGPYAVVVGDVNGDHKLDLVTANFASDTMSVLLGKGDGTFTANVDYPTGKSRRPMSRPPADTDLRSLILRAWTRNVWVSVQSRAESQMRHFAAASAAFRRTLCLGNQVS